MKNFQERFFKPNKPNKIRAKGKISLEQEIYNNIKKAIFHHILLPNDQLQEYELANFFKVSRTPVRAALHQLEYEGLVYSVPRKGYFVTNPSPEEITKVFFLRKKLEGLAAELATIKISSDQINILNKLLLAEKESYKQKNRCGVIDNSGKFHELIAHASENEWLAKFIFELIAQSNVYLTFYDPFDAEPPRSLGEHMAIIEAIASQKPKLAKKTMISHIESLEKHLNLDSRTNTGFDGWKEFLDKQKSNKLELTDFT